MDTIVDGGSLDPIKKDDHEEESDKKAKPVEEYDPTNFEDLQVPIRVGPELVFLTGCRISGFFLAGYRISGRIIRHCRISGQNL